MSASGSAWKKPTTSRRPDFRRWVEGALFLREDDSIWKSLCHLADRICDLGIDAFELDVQLDAEERIRLQRGHDLISAG